MLFKSPIISQGSGTIAGITYAHNRSGNYQRNWRVPTDPRTTLQADMRATFGMLATMYVIDLSDAQRTAWETYAANVPRLNPLGETIFWTGRNWFISMNQLAMQRAHDPILDAPGTFTQPVIPPSSLVLDTGSPTDLQIVFDDTQPWTAETGDGLMVFASRIQNTTVSFWKGPYVFQGVINGDTTTPPTSPLAMPYTYGDWSGGPFPIKIFFRLLLQLDDGRFTTAQTGFGFA